MLLLISTALGATAASLVTSMEVPSADLVDATLDAHTDATAVQTSMGTISPEAGSDFAWLYTGKVGVGPETGTDINPMGTKGDRSTLTLELAAPAGANSLVFEFYFLSAEYPEYVGSAYNDTFQAIVTGSAYTGNAAQDSGGNDINVNSVLFAVTAPSDLSGTGFENVGGGTGWLTTVVPVDPSTNLTLEFTVYDVGDGILDSGVALDNFYWSESDIDTPMIVRSITIDYLTPKRAPEDGGIETAITGEDFNDSCIASFDGVEAPTTYVDDNTLTALVPAHEPGLVDVTVSCIAVEDILEGGFTYYTTEDGAEPPALHSASPYNHDNEGGEVVTVLGEGFVDGATFLVDGVDVGGSLIDGTQATFYAPAHEAGLVDLEIVNPDGLADVLHGALLYNEPVELPDTAAPDSGPADSGTENPDDPLSQGTGCTTVPIGAAWLLGLFLIRRRR